MGHVNGWWEGVLRLKSNNRISFVDMYCSYGVRRIYVYNTCIYLVPSYPLSHLSSYPLTPQASRFPFRGNDGERLGLGKARLMTVARRRYAVILLHRSQWLQGLQGLSRVSGVFKTLWVHYKISQMSQKSQMPGQRAQGSNCASVVQWV